MKRVNINQKLNHHDQTRTLISSLLPLMLNDNYLYLDSSGRILEHSQNATKFFRTILNTTVEVNTPLLEKLISDKKMALAVHYFLDHNISNEIVDINIPFNSVNIQLRLVKIFYRQEHLGYNCILKHKQLLDVPPVNAHIIKLQDFSKLMNKTLGIGLNAINDASFYFSGDKKNIYKKLSSDYHLLTKHTAMMLASLEETFHISAQAKPKITIVPKFTTRNIKNIMVIESERLNHMVIRSMLKSISENFNVFSFMSVDEASEFIRTHPTDLIFLEFELAESAGNKFLEAVDQLMLNIPVILSSTAIDSTTIDKIARFSQIKGLLDRPINKENLLHIFNS